MELDLPEIRTLDLDGAVAFREWDGPADTTFVLLHGLGGSHLNWVQVAPGLAGLGRVVAPDLPGFGRSPLHGRSARLMDLRRTLARFVDETATGRTVLVGNSMGGAIALLHAAIDPEGVAGLVLTCSAYPWTRGAIPHPVVVGAFAVTDTPGLGDAFVAARLRALSPERIVRIGLMVTTADPRRIPEDVVRLHVDLVREQRGDPEAPTAFVQAARSLLRLGRRPDVSVRAFDAVRAPVLVLHGRKDRLVPARAAEAVLARYPAWRGRIFPDLGHVPQMEDPGRWLAEVADWSAARLR
jgi:pimeloyl-ACP methyl ester carboxylesterase